MENIRIRAGFRVAAGIAALALPLAIAGNAFANPNGDNGDVKIHNITTGVDEQDNQPHVCKFYLDAFNFDQLQSVHWEIDTWAGSDSDDAKGALAAQGNITLKADGTGLTTAITLPDDHYKLFWTFAGENGKAKHKAFWVDCGDADLIGGVTVNIGGSSTSGTKSGGVTGNTGSGGGSGSTGGSTGGATSAPSPSTPKSTAPTTAPTAGSPSTNTTEATGKLAHTGADGSALIYAALGAAVLAGGGYGLRRYATMRGKA